MSVEQLLRDGLEPAITEIQINSIEVDGKYVLAMGIPATFTLPHMVTLAGSNKFYRRSNSGKYLVDVYELNRIFMRQIEIKDRAREFIASRVNRYRRDGANNSTAQNFTFIHLIPFSRFGENFLILDRTTERILLDAMAPLSIRSYDRRYNLDGYMTFKTEGGMTISYNQLFRDGCLEMFSSCYHTIRPNQNPLALSPVNDFMAGLFEKEVQEALQGFLKVYDAWNVPGPYALFLNIYGVKNGMLYSQGYRDSSMSIDRDNLSFDPIIIQTPEANITEVLRPLFTNMWQAGGIDTHP